MMTSGVRAIEPVVGHEGATLVAIVDEDEATRRLIRALVEEAGDVVTEVSQRDEVVRWTEASPQIMCMDLSQGEGVDFQLIRKIHAENPHMLVLVVMSQTDAETAVAAMHAGAFDYLTKPLDGAKFLAALSRAKESLQLGGRAKRLEREFADRLLKGSMGGCSEAIVRLDGQVAKVIDRDVAVCLIGEDGAGKELVARAICQGSHRKHGPYVQVDCAAFGIREQEAVLFGEALGSGQSSSGAFEQASGGTLFLSHVGALSARAQAALCLTLGNRTVRRVGDGAEVSVNVRVIASHPESLHRLVERGVFREDLYFRLVVYPIFVPPLRARMDDIPLLVSHLLSELSGGVPRQFSPEALDVLVRYPWPGNLRELEHVVHRSLLTAREETISTADLPPEVTRSRRSDLSAEQVDLNRVLGLPKNEIVPLRDLERLAIEHALRVTNGSVSAAAQKLGIGRATLYRRVASLGLSQHVA